MVNPDSKPKSFSEIHEIQNMETDNEEITMDGTKWADFVEFVTLEVKPPDLPESFSFPEEVLEQLAARIDYGLDDQLVAKHYADFHAAIEASVEPGDSEEKSYVASSVLDDFNALHDEEVDSGPEYAVETSDPFADPDPFSEVNDLFQQEESSKFTFDALPTDDQLEDDDQPQELEDEVEEVDQNDADEHGTSESAEQVSTRQNGPHDPVDMLHYQNQPVSSVPAGSAPGMGHAMYRMATGLLNAGANVMEAGAAGIKGAVSPMYAWGANRAAQVQERLLESAQSVDDKLNEARELTQEEANSQRNNFRQDNLQAATKNLSAIMEQGRNQFGFINENVSPGIDMTVAEMAHEVRQSQAEGGSDSKMGAIAKHFLKEYVQELGQDKLIDTLQSLEYGNQLLAGHLQTVSAFGDKLGLSKEEMTELVGDSVREYSDQVSQASEVMDVLTEVAEEASVIDSVQKAQILEQLAQLKETIGKLFEKLGALFGNDPSVSAPSMV